jgi:hypothetical protein
MASATLGTAEIAAQALVRAAMQGPPNARRIDTRLSGVATLVAAGGCGKPTTRVARGGEDALVELAAAEIAANVGRVATGAGVGPHFDASRFLAALVDAWSLLRRAAQAHSREATVPSVAAGVDAAIPEIATRPRARPRVDADLAWVAALLRLFGCANALINAATELLILVDALFPRFAAATPAVHGTARAPDLATGAFAPVANVYTIVMSLANTHIVEQSICKAARHHQQVARHQVGPACRLAPVAVDIGVPRADVTPIPSFLDDVTLRSVRWLALPSGLRGNLEQAGRGGFDVRIHTRIRLGAAVFETWRRMVFLIEGYRNDRTTIDGPGQHLVFDDGCS